MMRSLRTLSSSRSTRPALRGLIAVFAVLATAAAAIPASADNYSVLLNGSGGWMLNGATYSGTILTGMTGTWELDLDDSLWPDASDSTARFDHIWTTYFAGNYDATPGAEAWRGYFNGSTLPAAPRLEFDTSSPGGILVGDVNMVILVRDYNANGILEQNEKHHDAQCTIALTVDPSGGTGAFENMTGSGSLSAGNFNFVNPPQTDAIQIFGQVQTEAPPAPCVSVTCQVGCDISKEGDEVSYEICVTNCGDAVLYSLTVIDDVLGDLTTLFPNSLGIGETQCRIVPYTIQPGDPDPVVNTVMVGAEDQYGTPASDTAMESVDLIHPAFEVDVTCLTGSVPPGDDAEFEVVITNTGDCDLDISTDEPSIPPFTLDPGSPFVQTVFVPSVPGEPEVCYEIGTLAEIPPEYCELPNQLEGFAEDCCMVESAIWYVPDDYQMIGDALAVAQAGETIIVRPGTYEEYALQMQSGVTLMGETGDPADVVIEGNYYGQIMWGSGLSDLTVISGITFTHGYAYGSNGGALSLSSSYVTVENCAFSENQTYYSSGAAVGISGGNPAFTQCRFEANVSDDFGGGMYINNSSPGITDCRFIGNTGLSAGGAIYLRSTSAPVISHTVFAGNYSDTGGAVFSTVESHPTVEGCTFYDNTGSPGAAMACDLDSFIDVARSIVVANSGGVPFYEDGSAGAGVLLECCDVWGNPAGDYVGAIAGQNGVNGNFSDNPYFCSADEGDLSIHENSPCVDAPGCGLVGALAVGCGPHAILVPTDYATIQEGVDAAAPGDTVLVLAGEYHENVIVSKSGLTILGGGERGRQAAVVDGGGVDATFLFTASVDTTTTLQGFEITNGHPGVTAFGSPRVVENWFHDNSVNNGGGFFTNGGAPIVEDNRFTSNHAIYGGGIAFYFASGGRIVGNDIDGNTSDHGPGGILMHESSPLIAANLVRNNDAPVYGGGMRCNVNSSPSIVNNTFVGNSAGYDAGGIYFESGETPDISANIVASNINGGIYCSGTSSATISCNDVWDNTGGNYTGGVADQTGLNGNFSLDPMFCDPEQANFAIHDDSPCVDAPGCGLVGALGAGCSARIWYVPDDAPTIAAAVDSAFAGDTIIVRPGTYNESNLVMKSGVVLESESGNADDTIIDAQSTERAFVCNGLSAETAIRGFTITNGFTYAGPGGGMTCTDSYLTVEDCFFYSNTTYMSDAGGVAVSGGQPSFIGCVFAYNTAEVSGGAMYVASSSPTITDCWFASNSSFSEGGALYLDEASPTVTFTLFISNDAYEGGAVFGVGDSHADFTNCTFAGNDAGGIGPAMSLSGLAQPTLNNSIVAFHTSPTEPIVCGGGRAGVTLSCCDVYGNQGGDYSGCLAGQGEVNGNFSEDPLFCSDGEATTFQLAACSPCADAPGCGQVGALGVGCGGRIWVVPDDAPTIQAAVDSAAVCDTVFVLPGTYNEHDIMLKSYVTIVGDTSAGGVTIDGQDLGTVFWADNDDHAVLRNLTITGGSNVEGPGGLGAYQSYLALFNVTFSFNQGDEDGAIRCIADSCHLTDCTFIGNTAGQVGAVGLEGDHGFRLTRCVFEGNSATGNCGALYVTGAGTLDDCGFIGNESGGSGGGLLFGAQEVTLDLTGCTFVDNHADLDGGGLKAGSSGPSHPEISLSGCVFQANTSNRDGGAAFITDGTLATFTGCTLHENSAASNGGGIESYSTGTMVVLDHTIISGSLGGEAVSCTAGSVGMASCCDVYGNVGGDWVGCLAPFAPPSYNNLSLDPMYCDPGSGDLHIDMESPCADAYACGLVGALPVGCGLIWYVPDDAPTIAAGIDSAGHGDTVIVRPGTYYEHDLVMKPGVHLEGESAGRGDVTIDAQGLGRVFYCSGLDSTTVISNLTIAHGDTVGAGDDGGGMYCYGSSHRVETCTFYANVAGGLGGAVRIEGGAPVFVGCVFDSCSSIGGGVYITDGSSEFTNCVFTRNEATTDGYGGAIGFDVGESLVLTGCDLIGNTASHDGGAVATAWVSSVVLSDCRLIGNTTTSGSGGGIAFYGSESVLEMTSCLLSGNTAPAGGALRAHGQSILNITDCTLAENATTGHGSGISLPLAADCQLFLSNTIIALGDGSGEAVYCGQVPELISLSCCDVYGNAGGDYVGCIAGYDGQDGNISEDPLFCGGADPDNPYTLMSTSPCAGENNPGCGQIGAYGIGCAGFVDWDAGGDGMNWEDPDNWDPDQVPGEFDHARILLDGTYSVYYNSISDIWALTHGATSGVQTLDIQTGSLAVTHGAVNTQEIVVREGATFDASVGRDSSVVVNEPDATFTLDGGDLVGTGTFINRGLFNKIGSATSHLAITFENQEFARGGLGTMEADAGTLSVDGETSTDGRLNVNSGATAIVSQHFIRGERQSVGSLTNRGLVTVAPDGMLGADATLAIANEDGGIVALNDGDLIGSGRFVNSGLVEKFGSGTSHVLLTFDNLSEERGGVGTVGAEAGTLSLEGETNSDGRLNVNSGATAIVSQHFIRGERGGRQGAAFDNGGEVTIEPGGSFLVDPTGSVWSSGMFSTRGQIAVAPGASFASRGNLVVRYGGALYAAGEVTNEAGGNLINNGLAHVPGGGLLTNDGYFDHRENGLLKGSGTVDNEEGVAAIKGLVAPGDSHGTLTYLGNFIQAPTSEISFEIGGYEQGVDYDLLDITGVAVFSGALDLSFTGGFEPVLDDSFQVIAHSEPGGRDRIDFDCFAGLGVSDSLHMMPIQRFGKLLFLAVGGSTGDARPVASNDMASVTGYEPITIDVLANDTDADLDPLRVIILNLDQTEGVAYINEADSLVSYAAVPGFAGADSFDYVVTDCVGGSDTGRVYIDVTAPPEVWYVPDDSATIAGALALASPGDTVIVACGTYYESNIVVPGGVTLISETGDPDCVIINASGRVGRGLVFVDVDETCVVQGMTITGGSTEEIGAGVYCDGASPRLIDCIFTYNVAASGGGGAGIDNGAAPSFEGCEFFSNSATAPGGGMLCRGASAPLIDDCLFWANWCPTATGGGVMVDALSEAILSSCTLEANYAYVGGGLYVAEGAAVTVDHTIITNSYESEAVACAPGGSAMLSCSDVYGNDGGDWVGCIDGQNGVNGNFSLDPLFCDAQIGDFHLLPDSPCRDAEGCGLVGAFEAGCVADPEIQVDPSSFAFEVGEGGTTSDVLQISDLGRSQLSWLIRENGPVPEVTDPKPVVRAKVLPRELATALEPMRPAIPHVEVEKGESDPREGRGPTRGAGGPDGFGHTWIDNDEPFGPTYDWREISEVGTALALPDDGSQLVVLPFAFPFYESLKSFVRVSSNGYLTFGLVGADYSNDPIPDSWVPNDIVAPFWDDLNPTLGGAIYYYHDPVREEFVVEYDNVYDYYGAGPYTFEVVLTPAGRILFLYDEIAGDPSEATVGIENGTGTDGLEIAFNAPYIHGGLAVLIEDPAPWLTEDPPSGVTAGLGNVSVTLEVDTEGLIPGLHLVTLVVESNDPDEPEVMIPVSLLIGGTDVDGDLPTRYVLHGNYPNPFNPRTEIRYDLPAPATVSLRVYSIAGRLVRELLVDERQGPGRFAIPWNGRDDGGERVASGVYYYKLEADGKVRTNRMVLLK